MSGECNRFPDCDCPTNRFDVLCQSESTSELSEPQAAFTGLLGCPSCGQDSAERERHASIFAGQDYGDRYPDGARTQHHGFRVRCECCGMQTCWWHYQSEADQHWNTRAV